MSHVLQKATIDGQLLDLTIDLQQLPEWKREVVVDMVGIINSPTATEDEREMSRTTLADVFLLFESGGRIAAQRFKNHIKAKGKQNE